MTSHASIVSSHAVRRRRRRLWRRSPLSLPLLSLLSHRQQGSDTDDQRPEQRRTTGDGATPNVEAASHCGRATRSRPDTSLDGEEPERPRTGYLPNFGGILILS